MSILFAGLEEDEVKQVSWGFAKALKEQLKDLTILGPAPSVISKMNNDYRYRILIKYKNSAALTSCLTNLLNNYKGKVKVDVDVNPYSQM